MKQLICILFSGFLFINCEKKQDIKTVTTIQLKELLSKSKIQLIDVRTPEEVSKGSIKTALIINYFDSDFGVKTSKKLNKDKPVYLFCRTGNRSRKAAKILKEKGFDVYNVLGGYTKWQTEN